MGACLPCAPGAASFTEEERKAATAALIAAATLYNSVLAGSIDVGNLALHGPEKAFQFGVEAALGDSDVLCAFSALFPRAPRAIDEGAHQARVADVTQRFLRKFTNAIANALCARLRHIFDVGGSKQGVGVRQELKVLQSVAAKKLADSSCPVKFDAARHNLQKVAPPVLHLMLKLVVASEDAAVQLAAGTAASLKALIEGDGGTAKAGAKKAALAEQLIAAVGQAEGFAQAAASAVSGEEEHSRGAGGSGHGCPTPPASALAGGMVHGRAPSCAVGGA